MTTALTAAIVLVSSWSGLAIAQQAPGPGDLVLSELLIDPASGSSEWIEVTNPSGTDSFDLDGCFLVNGGDFDPAQTTCDSRTCKLTPVTDGDLVVGPGERFLLGKGTASDFGDEAICLSATGKSCLIEADNNYYSIALSNSEAKSLEILCLDGTETEVLVDGITYDWSGIREACDEGEATWPGGCAWGVEPGNEDATVNDDAEAWCLASQESTYPDEQELTTLGTPGAENTCFGDTPPPEDICQAGEVLITELMPSPGDQSDEWIELFGLADEGCNLHTCELRTSSSSDPFLEDDDTRTHAISAGGSLRVESDAYVLLAKALSTEVAIAWEDESGSSIAADYLYGYQDLYLSSSEQWLHLVCGEEAVDSARFAWEAFLEVEALHCPEGGCSMNLHPDLTGTDDNDTADAWCIPPEEGNAFDHLVSDTETIPLVATLGRIGECPPRNPPQAGEVVFTEIMPSPSGTEEWFEVLNTADVERELTGCRLTVTDPNSDTDEGSAWVFGEDGVPVTLEAGALQVFSARKCLFPSPDGTDTGDTGDTGTTETVTDCPEGEVIYGSVAFTAEEDRLVALECEVTAGDWQPVDAFPYNAKLQGVASGHALMLDTENAGPQDYDVYNDTQDNWCEAGMNQLFLEVDAEHCNFGSPGELAACPEVVYPEETIPCRCGSAGQPLAWWPMSLVALLGVGLRRRRRELDDA